MDADVIVVGAGPTGLMLAAELRLAGVSTRVLERRTERVQESRALGFSARTIEEFDQRGLLPRLGRLQTIPVGHFGGLPLDYRVIPGGSYGARGVPQSVTERILADWAAELGAEVCRGTEVVDLDAGDAGVEVETSGPGGRQRLRARYLVGCDGARSTVRRLVGIDFPGTDATIEMWLADVAGCQLRHRFSGERVPGGMVMVLPMGPEAARVVVYERAAPLRRTLEPPTFDEVADAWKRLTGEDIRGGRPLWVSFFTDASRQAVDYRRGRVFLAGDAAHVHLPIGGQGMSAGIQDAVNLGWKLGATVRGHAPDGLLDTYHAERHPVGARVLANTLAQAYLYLRGDEIQPLRDLLAELMAHEEVRRLLAGMVTGLDIRYDVDPGDHPLLGRRLRDAALVGARVGETSVYEWLRSARGLILDLADDERIRAAAAPWADRVDVLTATPEAAGPDGPDGPLDGIDALLVRPDGYAAWVGTGPDGLPAALGRWFGPSTAER